jgi:hypothetical protein
MMEARKIAYLRNCRRAEILRSDGGNNELCPFDGAREIILHPELPWNHGSGKGTLNPACRADFIELAFQSAPESDFMAIARQNKREGDTPGTGSQNSNFHFDFL